MILPLLVCCLPAAEVPDPAAQALEAALAASRARTVTAETEAAWQSERERLQVVIDQARHEAEQHRTAAEADRAAAVALTSTATTAPAPVDEVLTAGATRLRTALQDLAQRYPPGAVTVPSAATVEDVAAAVAASERAAAAVTIEVLTGQVDGTPRAAQVLRLAGARAWWLALDGRAGGVVVVSPTGLVFQPVPDPAPIAAAIAALQGPAAPAVALLPEGR